MPNKVVKHKQATPTTTPIYNIVPSATASVLTSYLYKTSTLRYATENAKTSSTKTVINHKTDTGTNTNSNINNDIFLLEPDAIDYGDLISQYISISNNSDKNNKNSKKNYANNNNNNNSSSSSSSKEYELTNSAAVRLTFSFSAAVCYFCFFFFFFAINTSFIF